MQIQELMASGIYDADANQPLRLAAQTMRARRTVYLLVRDGGTVVGALSAKDITDAYAEGLTEVASVKVRDVMNPEVHGLHVGTTVERAIVLMGEVGASHAVVMDDDGIPQGIVSFGDLTLRGGPKPE